MTEVQTGQKFDRFFLGRQVNQSIFRGQILIMLLLTYKMLRFLFKKNEVISSMELCFKSRLLSELRENIECILSADFSQNIVKF